MELTPDTKYLLAEKLSGKDLVKLCSTDKEMRKICSGEKYNKIWQDKLKKDYNVNYKEKNAYMEYLQNTYFYNKKYYIVTIVSYGYVGSNIFKERKDAINWIASEINEQIDISFATIRATLDAEGEILLEDFGTSFYLTESSFNNNNKIKDYESEYNEKIQKIIDIIGSEDLDIEEFKMLLSENIDLEIFITKLKESFNITEEVEMLITELFIQN